METNNTAIEILEKSGIKPTIQRVIILEELMKSKMHPTVDGIYSKIRTKFPTLSLATVYNTLEILERHKLIRSIKVESEHTRYDYAYDDHIHLFIKETNEIIDFYDEEVVALIKSKLKENNYTNYSIENINIELNLVN
jgi:Fur family peroxide stress response transcriptional regulator